MHTTVTIDRAGRIIVPKAVRDAFQLEARDTLELESEGERLTLRPVRAGSALRKEQGVWVFRRGGALITSLTCPITFRAMTFGELYPSRSSSRRFTTS